MSVRKWAVLFVAACACVAPAALVSRAGDDAEESPLAKIMKKIDAAMAKMKNRGMTTPPFLTPFERPATASGCGHRWYADRRLANLRRISAGFAKVTSENRQTT